MKEPGALCKRSTDSAGATLGFPKEKVRSVTKQRGAAHKLVLLLTAAALCFGVVLYFGGIAHLGGT
jgi:hypothetical protein